MVPDSDKIQLPLDKPIGTQIAKILDRQGDQQHKANLWAFFNIFQEEMKSMVRIPKKIVEKYKDTICFMVNKDECMIEAVQPRIIWIMPMGYEVDVATLDGYAQHLLTTPFDEK